MLITKTAIANLQTTFSMLYAAAWGETPIWSPNIATTIPSSTKTNTYGWMQRVPQMREWLGPRLFQNLNTHSYTVENRDWELTVKVPRNDFSDDNLGVWNPLMSEMGRQGRKLPDVLIQQALALGTTALGFDGVPFFSAAHPLNPAGVQSNLFTTTFSLNSANLNLVRAAMTSYTGEDGLPLGIVPDLLIVPPILELAAKQLLNAEIVQGASAGISNMQRNSLLKGYIVVPELAAAAPALTDPWFLADTSRGIKPLIYQLREAVKLVSLVNVDDPNVFFHKEFIWGQDGRGAASYGPWFLMAKAQGT
jgi:phage major head subunit gpT-like protein